jgi:hypothetical protein
MGEFRGDDGETGEFRGDDGETGEAARHASQTKG